MTDKEILKKAIEKADKSGYIMLTTSDKEIEGYLIDKRYYGLIFNQSFAKAFWGEELLDRRLNAWKEDMVGIALRDRAKQSFEEAYEDRVLPAWKMHLQQLVLEKEPLNYLKKFL